MAALGDCRQLAVGATENLLEFLDSADQPFNIAVRSPHARKRKRLRPPTYIQKDLWHERLTVEYTVAPNDLWQKLRNYRKFTGGKP